MKNTYKIYIKTQMNNILVYIQYIFVTINKIENLHSSFLFTHSLCLDELRRLGMHLETNTREVNRRNYKRNEN